MQRQKDEDRELKREEGEKKKVFYLHTSLGLFVKVVGCRRLQKRRGFANVEFSQSITFI